MKNKGFTLMEMVLTVIIIAVLVSIAVPSYISTVERARAREARATLDSMRAAEYMYSAERRAFIQLDVGSDAPWEACGLENPNNNARSSFSYSLTLGGGGFTGTATRLDGPNVLETITMDQGGNEGGTWSP